MGDEVEEVRVWTAAKPGERSEAGSVATEHLVK